MAERNELGRNLETLQHKARNLTDWRVHFRNHPAAFLGAAVGAGVVVGAMSYRHGNGSTAYRARSSELRQPLAPKPPREHGPKTRQLLDTWRNAGEALLAVATAKVVDVVTDYLPGFRDEFRRHATQPSAAFWQERSTSASRSGPVGFDPESARVAWDPGLDDR